MIIARSAIAKSAAAVAAADKNENELTAKKAEEELTVAEKTITTLENILNEKTVIALKASKGSSSTSGKNHKLKKLLIKIM
jgi:hypothetical protein